MPRDTLAKLGTGLVLSLGLMTSAWASHDYEIEIDVYELPSNDYTIAILPPLGNPPNSSCMAIWDVPAATKEIGWVAGFDSHMKVTVQDKNSGGCIGSDKYNTWKYQIRKYSTTPGSTSSYTVVGSGSFKFYHDHGNGWETQIKTTPKDNTPSGKEYVQKAYCSSNGVSTVNCLNKPVKGGSAADYISVYIGYTE